MKFIKQAATALSTFGLMAASALPASAMTSAPTGDIDDIKPFLVIGGVAIVIVGTMIVLSVVQKKK